MLHRSNCHLLFLSPLNVGEPLRLVWLWLSVGVLKNLHDLKLLRHLIVIPKFFYKHL